MIRDIRCSKGAHIPNKPQLDKAGQASPAFQCIGEPDNKDVEACKMFDFIIEMIADIEEIFVDLWVNKVINRKKKSNINFNNASESQGIQDGK